MTEKTKRLYIKSILDCESELNSSHILFSAQLAIIDKLLTGKTFKSSIYGNLTVVKIGCVDWRIEEPISSLDIYWNKKVNTQTMYFNNDSIEQEIKSALNKIANVDISESGMQGKNYSNFDVKWKLK